MAQCCFSMGNPQFVSYAIVYAPKIILHIKAATKTMAIITCEMYMTDLKDEHFVGILKCF